MTKAFVSSTSKDLEAYRQVANEECNRLGLVPIAMKYFPATGKGATKGSKRKLDEADLYVGIFAHRYGYIEEGCDKSVTEIEFDYAGNERRLDRLCFLVDPDYAWPESARDRENQERLEAFKNKIDKSVIRALFTSVEDFQGKLRLALIEWKLGTPDSGTPQPPLSLNLLKPTAANRLTYRSGQTPFVGRAKEMAVLDGFLTSEGDFLWLAVSGPAGSGKSRLVQEFCVRAAAHWRAGFLLSSQGFDNWASWKPSADTLIVIDYAAERVDEIGALLRGLVSRQDDRSRHTAVRVLLVEREGDGPWLKEFMGSRSESYAIEQARFSDSPLVLGPMDEEDLWEGIRSMLEIASMPPPARAQLMKHLRELDPLGRPLYAILAADALTSGRDIRDWDRERLMRDVLERERQGWAKIGITAPYESLLALATMAGGLTEAVLQNPAHRIVLPGFEDFDRSLYSAMTGCDPDGESLPPLKPDLLGEFFVLSHVKGRNDRVTANQTAELCSAAWKIVGGSTRRDVFGVAGVTYVSPSSLVLFLRRLIDDFSDHPAARRFLSRTREPGIDLRYWADLTVTGIRGYLASGDLENAKSLYEELSALEPRELHDLYAESELIKAAFSILPYAVGRDLQADPRVLLGRIRELAFAESASSSAHLAFCESAADAMEPLLESGEKELVQELLEDQHKLVRAHPDQEELRIHYSSGLGLLVCSEGVLEVREQEFKRLKAFCEEFRDDLTLYIAMAQAARVLCEVYVTADRLQDAERMNQGIRELVHLRSERRLIRSSTTFEEKWDVRVEVVLADLVAMELDLAETDVLLMQPLMRAQRYRDANQLLEEVNRLWQRQHPEDTRFAGWWGWAIIQHADAYAREGHFERIGKALSALHELSAKFPGNVGFAGFPSILALQGLKRAADAGEFSVAEEMFDTLEKLARETPAEPQPVADYAEGALALCTAYQKHGQMEESMRAPRAAASALRSEAYRRRLEERGVEEFLKETLSWLEAIGATNG